MVEAASNKLITSLWILKFLFGLSGDTHAQVKRSILSHSLDRGINYAEESRYSRICAQAEEMIMNLFATC
jgi:hypothetical protein